MPLHPVSKLINHKDQNQYLIIQLMIHKTILIKIKMMILMPEPAQCGKTMVFVTKNYSLKLLICF